MFSLHEEFSRAAMAAFSAQMANFDACAHAAVEAALSSMATATVAFDLAQAYSREATDAALNKPLFR